MKNLGMTIAIFLCKQPEGGFVFNGCLICPQEGTCKFKRSYYIVILFLPQLLPFISDVKMTYSVVPHTSSKVLEAVLENILLVSKAKHKPLRMHVAPKCMSAERTLLSNLVARTHTFHGSLVHSTTCTMPTVQK